MNKGEGPAVGIHYRHYKPGDEKQIVPLWNESAPKDPISPVRFRKLTLLDANFDPEGMRIATDGERIVGVAYAIRRQLPMAGTNLEPANGWIPYFFVAPAHRKQGIGSRLLEDALTFLRGHGKEKVFFSSYAPNYILPGIDEAIYPDGYRLLQKLGFVTQYSPVAMDYSLVGYEVPEDVKALKAQREAEGYTFRRAEDSDLYEAIQFANNVFNADWGRAIREGVLQGLPLSQILIARDNGKLVGFCLHGGYEGIRERFGPFGVDPGQQGKGLGKILLYECLAAMRAESLHGAWFLWTGEESNAGYLYKRVGFQITRTFHVMCKAMK
ncbi:MAG: GNAT family N-acetyltransferase [Paenibacillaceae bacterium]|nr:GNAT family N-acetyltransferase [Paenibacillaceae bacterium]